jgi:2-haloacid dehalogenase
MAVDYFRYQRHEIAFVAFAPWDAARAKWFGYPTFLINRTGVSAEELNRRS